MKKIDPLRLFSLLGILLLMSGSNPLQSSEIEKNGYFQERANLALRHIAHQMLSINGDSTTPIPPVRTLDGLQFIVRFNGELRYDTLRAVVDETLSAAGLPLRYDLALYDCLNESLVLGFMAPPQNGEVGYPCQDRGAGTECVDLAIRFPGQNNQFIAGVGWLGGIGIAIGLLSLFIRRRPEKEPSLSVQHPEEKDQDDHLLRLGNSLFNPRDLKITVNREEQSLTYREAKLLEYFCQKPNEILQREDILDAVWGEEGVQVTRSLDVFVSRLRKILRKDPQIQIANVHGIGYRLVLRQSD